MDLITSGAMNSSVPSWPQRSLSGPPSSFARPKSIILREIWRSGAGSSGGDLLDFQVVLVPRGEEDVVWLDVHVDVVVLVQVLQRLQQVHQVGPHSGLGVKMRDSPAFL